MLSVTEPTASPPLPAAFNLAAHVLAQADALADKMAMQIVRPTGAERWSYGRLQAAVRGAGTGLLARGLAPGDRVLLRLGNGPEFPVAFLGAIAVGLVPVPTSAQLTKAEVTALAEQIRPQLVIHSADIALPDGDWSLLDAASLLQMATLAPCGWHMGPADRPAYIIFTSGTSGRPFGVVHAHRAILARAQMHDDWEGLTQSDRLLHAGAFNWTFTLGTGLMDPWTVGATALIPGPGVLPAQLPLLLKRFDATIMAAAPGVIRQMLRAPIPALPRLRHGLCAGETLTPALRAAWGSATGTDLHEALGMSEVSTYLSGSPARPAPEGYAGYAQRRRRIAILATDGEPLPRGEPGELAISCDDPGLMLGYLDADDATAARYTGQWFRTGDMAEMREDRAIRYLGRSDDQLNPGGFRVSPQEVEAALAGIPGIDDLAITEVCVKDGTRVLACLYTGPAALDETQLAAEAATRLARYRQPRIWAHVTALPRNANGKLNRRALPDLWSPE
jgi:acyl-coenzyme A synthetase/AMP-(fatty) acid ligase